MAVFFKASDGDHDDIIASLNRVGDVGPWQFQQIVLLYL